MKKKQKNLNGACDQCKKLIDINNRLYERLSALIEPPKSLTPKYLLKTNKTLPDLPRERKGFTKSQLLNWAIVMDLKRDQFTISTINGVDNSVESRYAGKTNAYKDGDLNAKEL